jgi:mannose-1-phosphate guanylyltransferase
LLRGFIATCRSRRVAAATVFGRAAASGMPSKELRFFGERSLIRHTVDRLAVVISPENEWVVTNPEMQVEIHN